MDKILVMRMTFKDNMNESQEDWFVVWSFLWEARRAVKTDKALLWPW